MAPRQLSNTLPKNFVFSGLNEPITPERPSTGIDVPPPLTRHSFSSSLRVNRVRSGTDVCARMELDRDLFRLPVSPEYALPSIEVPPSPLNLGPKVSDDRISDGDFLAPPRRRMEFVTPPAQTELVESCDTGRAWPLWDQTPLAITRSNSLCSNDSDSSIESIETIDTLASRPSVGSFTSDEGDHVEPKESNSGSSISPTKKTNERTHFKNKTWSQEMDNHLWNTYQMYLSDPTVTPFKMTPGAVPPLGVTTRVARVAKLNWQKNMRSTQAAPSPWTSTAVKGPQTSRVPRSGKPVWPKSNRKIRQRLKLLCVRKFSITPHYHRMMQSRSPEPVQHGNAPTSGAYSTRDLGVSLATPHETTPLTQLAEETESNWKEKPHSHSRGLSHGTGLSSIPPRLGSPFVPSPHTWSPSSSSRLVDATPRSARRQTIHVPARRLRRTTHMNIMTPRDQDEPFTLTSYAESNPADEEVRRRLNTYVQDNQLQDIGNGRVRIRSRGATMGASGERGVSQLFSPPYSSATEEETTPAAKLGILANSAKAREESAPATMLLNPLLDLDGEGIKRLGSPFKVNGSSQGSMPPRRSIRHMHSSSDSFVEVMLNPFEEGISDAERIRRQILQQRN